MDAIMHDCALGGCVGVRVRPMGGTVQVRKRQRKTVSLRSATWLELRVKSCANRVMEPLYSTCLVFLLGLPFSIVREVSGLDPCSPPPLGKNLSNLPMPLMRQAGWFILGGSSLEIPAPRLWTLGSALWESSL